MKKSAFLFLLVTSICVGQKNKSTKLGLATKKELQMSVYKKDTTANAIVLYEHANVYIDESNDFNFRTDYYHRIKLFKKEAFDRATISISLYKKERVEDVKAVTYNLYGGKFVREVHFLEKNVFKKKVTKNRTEVTFTLPNVKEGSVIEYVYSVISPYNQLDDWYFQSDIPKIKSNYSSAILGNWKYKIRIVGFLNLDEDNPSVKKNCVFIPGIGNGSCSVLSYGMKDIPAFKDEDYMLSKKNFISRLVFDLVSFTGVKGDIKKYTKTWKDADRTFKQDYFDGQTSKKSFFKKNLPQEIILEADELTRAKKIYDFIQDRFSWNEAYWTSKQLKIKDIFKEKTGSVDAINLTLYNSLQAVNIESYLMMLSTRQNGVPTTLYPVTADFNYMVVKVKINDKEYLLDATNKNLSFGLLPYRCLNGKGRVLDFKNGSYWQAISPNIKTSKRTKIRLELYEEGLKGTMQINRTGYFALNQREKINTESEDEYLENFEADYPHIEVVDYTVNNKNALEKQLEETYEIVIEEDFENSNTLRIYPFIVGRTSVNPFKLDQRDYPVDFGYARKYTYLLSLTIPDGYKVSKLPPKKSVGLPNKGGSFSFNIAHKGNKVNLFFKSSINKTRFSNREYFYLKEFYKQLIEVEGLYIELIKK